MSSCNWLATRSPRSTKNSQDIILKINKSLYGQVSSPTLFWELLQKGKLELGVEQAKSCQCLLAFFKQHKLIYCDDQLLTYHKTDQLKNPGHDLPLKNEVDRQRQQGTDAEAETDPGSMIFNNKLETPKQEGQGLKVVERKLTKLNMLEAAQELHRYIAKVNHAAKAYIDTKSIHFAEMVNHMAGLGSFKIGKNKGVKSFWTAFAMAMNCAFPLHKDHDKVLDVIFGRSQHSLDGG
jgi:hypothetical protein